MTQLGKPVPSSITRIRSKLKKVLASNGIKEIDAGSVITGKDFLNKIWGLLVSVPMGIAIIDETMSSNTRCNIFYEIGLMHSLGKETLVIKTEGAEVPSDFVRTEYIKFDGEFNKNIKEYFRTYWELPDYYETIADQLDRNPLLAIDYLRRAYLIKGDVVLKDKARRLHTEAALEGRARNSVEQLLVDF
ncbi:MAG: indoleamine 2,3-dioxygenase [Nitrospirota bacterium]|nr:indoleamine 2,3-dioxygenase [Nitrospirota bacterium]